MEIYLDHQTATPLSPKVLAAYTSALKRQWGSSSAPHRSGQSLLPLCKEAYKTLYAVFGADTASTFVFTSSGAEAINQVVLSTYLEITRKLGKNHYVTSTIDEAPIAMSMSRLQEELGCLFSMAPVEENGQVSTKNIAASITPRTALVSLSWGSGLTGVLHPIEEIGNLCREKGILFHVDATHVIGKVDFDFASMKVDFLTFNGSQIFAPCGTGGLFIKEKSHAAPLILGGTDQAGYRGGQLDIPGLHALSVAAHELKENQDLYGTEVAYMRNLFEKGLQTQIPEAEVLFSETMRLPHITSLSFPHVKAEALSFLLNEKGIYSSFGGGMMQQITHVLKASQLDSKKVLTALSFGLSHTTTEAEIERAVIEIGQAYHHLKKFGEGVAL